MCVSAYRVHVKHWSLSTCEKIGMQNAQAEQIKAVKELANRVVEKDTELDKITKRLRATTMKVERRKRKVRGFFFSDLYPPL